MAQLLVRNVSEATIVALKQRAAANQRSVEAEHRALLEETLEVERLEKVARFRTLIEAMHGQQDGLVFTPSDVVVREMRDET